MDINNIKDKLVDFYQAKKHLVWIGGVALLILVAILVVFTSRGNTIKENVQYVQVSRGSITETIGEVGNVESQPSAIITWQRSDARSVPEDYATPRRQGRALPGCE